MTVWAQTLLGFVVAWVVLSYKSDFNVRVFDEGLTLYGSWRVANGEVPHRDFWTTYGPGSFYVGALGFHLFGASVATLRKIWLAFQSIAALEVLILARMFGGTMGGCSHLPSPWSRRSTPICIRDTRPSRRRQARWVP